MIFLMQREKLAVLVLGDSNFGKFEVEKELKASGHALKSKK